MQPIEIDPEFRAVLSLKRNNSNPEFAGQALRVTARPVLQGFDCQLEWKEEPPAGDNKHGASKHGDQA